MCNISTAIRQHFKLHGISYEDAAQVLGQSKQTVANRISTGKFSPITARLWGQVFGFNEQFLLEGVGQLENDAGNENSMRYEKEIRGLRKENRALKKKIRMLEKHHTEQ